jgi:hypothetical protein
MSKIAGRPGHNELCRAARQFMMKLQRIGKYTLLQRSILKLGILS